jgi:hypothetical protein
MPGFRRGGGPSAAAASFPQTIRLRDGRAYRIPLFKASELAVLLRIVGAPMAGGLTKS